ncbi:MAG TPA: hypothetical protein VNI02_02000 [Blastocatellia bacterium]|nr:hypothetical protein [Blastocatellia bacterium]
MTGSLDDSNKVPEVGFDAAPVPGRARPNVASLLAGPGCPIVDGSAAALAKKQIKNQQ